MASQLISVEEARLELARLIYELIGPWSGNVPQEVRLVEMGERWAATWLRATASIIPTVGARAESLAMFSARWLQPLAEELVRQLYPSKRPSDHAWTPATGDTVWLASGSPPLTVFGMRQDGFVDVEWFAGPDVRRDAFHIHCLRNFTPEPANGARLTSAAESPGLRFRVDQGLSAMKDWPHVD